MLLGAGSSSADLVLIGRVRDAMEVFGMNQIDVMRESGVSNSVLCLWLQGKYKGDNAKVNDRLHKWIEDLPPPSSDLAPSTSSPSSSTHSSSLPFHVFQQPPSYSSSHRPSHADQLIPIRLNCAVGQQRYEDTFLWSLFEHTITPRVFIQSLCNDVGLPHAFIQPLTQQMKDQLRRYRRLMKDKDERDNQHLPSPLTPPSRLLHLQLNLTLDGLQLSDRFLWDPSHPSSSPEEFGRVLALELGLSGEWAALIAWSVRDQLVRAMEGGGAAGGGGGGVEEVEWSVDEEGGGVFREADDGWGPVVSEVYSRLEHVDSQGAGSTGVEQAVHTEYEKEKERARLVQRMRKREDKDREKEREKERERQMQALQQQQAQVQLQLPMHAVPVLDGVDGVVSASSALQANYARFAQVSSAADPFRFQP